MRLRAKRKRLATAITIELDASSRDLIMQGWIDAIWSTSQSTAAWKMAVSRGSDCWRIGDSERWPATFKGGTDAPQRYNKAQWAPHPPTPVLLLIAASSRYEDALAWGLHQAEREFGPAAAISDAFDFTETDYYAADDGLRPEEAIPGLRAADRSGRLARSNCRPTTGRPSMPAPAGTRNRGRSTSIPAT